MQEGFSASVGEVSNGVEGDVMLTKRARWWITAGVLGCCAFGLGMSGLPGVAMAEAGRWAVENGWVELAGPVGELVKHAMG